MTDTANHQSKTCPPTVWSVVWLASIVASIGFVPSLGSAFYDFTKSFLLVALAAVGGVAFAVQAWRRRQPIVLPWPMLALGGLWLFVMIVSLARGVNYNGVYQIARWGGLFVIVVVVVNTLRRGDLKWLGRALSLVYASLGAVALVGSLFVGDSPNPGGYEFGSPLKLTSGNQNLLSGFLTLGLPMLIAAALTEKQRDWRIITGLALVAVAAMIVATQSRAGVLCAAVCLVAGAVGYARVVLNASWSRVAMVGGGAAAAVVLLLAFAAPDRLSRKLLRAADDGVPSWREFAYDAAWDSIAASPDRLVFGQGASAFRYQFSAVDPRDYGLVKVTQNPQYVHNEYLELGVEGGAVAIVLFAVVVITTLAWAVRFVRLTGNDDDDEAAEQNARVARVWVSMFALAVAVFCVYGLVSVANRNPGMLFNFALGLAGVWALTQPPVGRSPRRASSTLIGVLLLAGTSAAVMANCFFADRALQRGVAIARDTGDMNSALRAFEQANVFGRHEPEALLARLRITSRSTQALTPSRPIYEKLQATAPQYRNTGAMFGQVLARAGQYREAAEVFGEYLASRPFDFAVHAQRAHVAARAGEQTATEAAMVDMLQAYIDFASIGSGWPIELSHDESGPKPTIIVQSAYTDEVLVIDRQELSRVVAPDGSFTQVQQALARFVADVFDSVGAPPVESLFTDAAP